MRIKKTFSTNSEVINLWLSQSQDYGTNGNRSLFFEKNTIYSYGHHYPLASIHIGIEKIILINSASYSVTTQKHKFMVCYRNSTGKTYLFLPYPTEPKNPENLSYLKNRIKEIHQRLKASYLYQNLLYENLIEAINSYRLFIHCFYNIYKPNLKVNHKTKNQYLKEKDKILEDKMQRTIDNVLMSRKLHKKIKENTLKPKDIFKERNSQRRAVLLKQYTYEKLLINTNSEVVDKQIIKSIPYELIKIKTPKIKELSLIQHYWENEQRKTRTLERPEDIHLLKVKCPSTSIFYVLRIPPTIKTCLEALAWTFNQTPKEYLLLKQES